MIPRALIFTGDLGAGKTLSAVALAMIWSYQGNVPVLANFPVKGGERIECLEDWKKIVSYRESGSVVILDEASTILDSRTSQTKAHVKFTQFLQFLRKMRCIIMFTVPEIELVDVRVRRRISYHVHVSRIKGKMVWDVYDGQGIFLYSKIIKLDAINEFHQFYDSYELVEEVELPTDLKSLFGDLHSC